MAPRFELAVAADDRTGALETAGAIAEAIGRSVPVVTSSTPVAQVAQVSRIRQGDHPVVVVDLGTRHLPAVAAAARASVVDHIAARRHVHKIDSTLRGRWAEELLARADDGRRPVLVIPALPALGRICADGVVLADGRPVDEGAGAADPIEPPASARPAELLRRAGAHMVEHLDSLGQAAAWLANGRGIAVADARCDDDIVGLVRSCRDHPQVLIAGTSAVAAAAAVEVLGPAPVDPRVSTWRCASPEQVLVVVGSGHPVARTQVSRAADRGARVVTSDDPVDATQNGPVVLVDPPPSTPVDAAAALAHAADLAAAAHRWLAAMAPGMLVIIGGDTASAVLGDGPALVGGLVAPGTPWLVGTEQTAEVITRSGGFGGPDALADLLWGTLDR